MSAPKGYFEFEGKLMTASAVKHKFMVFYSVVTIRKGLLAGAQDLKTLCIVCDALKKEARSKAAIAAYKASQKSIERKNWEVPAHDYTSSDRAFLSWRGPADGRLYGMVGVAG